MTRSNEDNDSIGTRALELVYFEKKRGNPAQCEAHLQVRAAFPSVVDNKQEARDRLLVLSFKTALGRNMVLSSHPR